MIYILVIIFIGIGFYHFITSSYTISMLFNRIFILSGFFCIFFSIIEYFFPNSSKQDAGLLITLGVAMAGWGITNLNEKENNLKSYSEWRKNLFQLEQKKSYIFADLYKLNSYINHYSKNNKVSELINDAIINILKNENLAKTEKELITYLQLNTKKRINFERSEKQYKKSIFEFSISNEQLDIPLNMKQNNILRLCCHILLKQEWQEWIR